MTRPPRSLSSFVFVLALMWPTAPRADDQDVIDYRQHIMKTINEEAEAIAQILQQKIPPDDFATHAEILAITAATAKKAFEAKVPGGEAKPVVWANWNDFAKRLDNLTAATVDLAKTAKEGGMAAAAPKVQSALTCNSCHEIYREKKS